MDQVIRRARGLIDQTLSAPSKDRSGDFIYKKIRHCLEQFLEMKCSEDDQIRLFCRQMSRLLTYNESISVELAMEWHDDTLCIINDPNINPLTNDSRKRFLEKMDFERQLEQKKEQFQTEFRARKSFKDLFAEHQDFFSNYLRKCLSLHSTIRVLGLVENVDDLLSRTFGIADLSCLTAERRQSLVNKLQSIDIPLDCSKRVLRCYEVSSRVNDDHSKQFLPSIKATDITETRRSKTIEDVLRDSRWLMILGDPGNGKTSLLRWLTRVMAEKSLRHDDEEFVRIPILLRIGEFASWLDVHPTGTLIDYIGEHTWYAERYSEDNSKHIFRELIDLGHALILLDGLDNVPDVEKRGKIVQLVRTFIETHVRAPDFTSAFDAKIVRKHKYLVFPDTIETPLPSQSLGNQIVVTIRPIGYQLHPLLGPSIKHYGLSVMEAEEAREFAHAWMRLVEESVVSVVKKEELLFDEEAIVSSSRKRLQSVQSMFAVQSKCIKFNSALLSVICTRIFQSSEPLDLQSRVELYSHTVEASLRLWPFLRENISKEILTHFFIDLATYIHLHSPSDLIDEFDLRRLCYLTLEQHGATRNRTESRARADELIASVQGSRGFVIERGLQTFGFQHLSIQEYFVAQALVKKTSVEEVAKRIVSFTVQPRFHQALLLAVDWISCHWSFDDYDQFCHYLLTSTEEYSLPLGTILLFDALDDLQTLPSSSVLLQALNILFNHPSQLIRLTYFYWYLVRLPEEVILKWMQTSLEDDISIWNFCQCLCNRLQKRSDRTDNHTNLPSAVYRQLWSLHSKSLSIEIAID
jgi:hypothetical protein